MSWIDLAFVTAGFLVVVLFFLSLIEISIARLSQVSLKVLAEKPEYETIDLLGDLSKDRTHFLLPLQFGIQVIQSAIAVVVTSLCLMSLLSYAAGWALLIMLTVVLLFRQLLPKMLIRGDPERILCKLLPSFRNGYRLLRWLSAPVQVALRLVQGSQEKRQIAVSQEEEATEEEIEAYIEVGEDEGIIEEEESELIQSALEFGDTLVKGVMTSRAEMVAIEESATLFELKRLMVSSKYSRIPVYRGQVDQVVGVVYLRNVLAYLEGRKEEEPITPLVNKVRLVPETNRVSELLKEMQNEAEHMAIVVNEYGAVSGLVTIEDLVEEIVGEIRDEDEPPRNDVFHEPGGSYVIHGRLGIEELEDTLEIDLGDPDVTTVSGLIVSRLGRVPTPGETLTLDGLQVEIVNSDRRRIQTLRVRRLDTSAR